MENGRSRPENCGGNRQHPQDVEVTGSIIDHIKKFPVTESHYGRDKSCKQYLSESFSVPKMWRLWKNERRTNKQPVASLSKYKRIFLDQFNLAFGNPKTDVCSRCVALKSKIKAGIEERQSELELKLHELCAKKFYQLLSAARDDRKTLAVSFDMEQNQPVPKIPITESFYARQLWVYNLTFVIHEPVRKCRTAVQRSKKKAGGQSRKNVFLYSWHEAESAKSSNEIVSALSNFLRRIQKRVRYYDYEKLALFSDSCGGQNKNKSMITFLLRYVNSTRNLFRTIRYYFPIRGHSYMPPDRVFGRIERKLRRKTVMKTPKDYYNIFEEHGRLHILGKQWKVYDHKQVATTLFSPKSKLRSRTNRVWVFNPGDLRLYVSDTFVGEPRPVVVFKEKFGQPNAVVLRKPKIVVSQSYVSEAKRNDVMKLLSFCDLTEEEEEYFEQILATFCAKGKINTEKPVIVRGASHAVAGDEEEDLVL